MDDVFNFRDMYFTNLERAWWTGAVGVDVKPQLPPASGSLIWEASTPQTVNNQGTYQAGGSSRTTGFSFSPSVTPGSSSATFSDSITVTEPITTAPLTDWGVLNQTSGTNLNWNFSARTPCGGPGFGTLASCFGGGSKGGPVKPNEISRTQFQVNAAGRWRTNSLVTGNSLPIDYSVPVTFVDTYCRALVTNATFGDFCFTDVPNEGELRNYKTERYPKAPEPALGGSQLKLDPSAVIPVPIEDVSLSKNKADGSKENDDGSFGEQIEGTIKLAKRATNPGGTRIFLISNSPNAEFESVTGLENPSEPSHQRHRKAACGGENACFIPSPPPPPVKLPDPCVQQLSTEGLGNQKASFIMPLGCSKARFVVKTNDTGLPSSGQTARISVWNGYQKSRDLRVTRP